MSADLCIAITFTFSLFVSTMFTIVLFDRLRSLILRVDKSCVEMIKQHERMFHGFDIDKELNKNESK